MNDAVERRASRFLENAMEEDRKGRERERGKRKAGWVIVSRESVHAAICACGPYVTSLPPPPASFRTGIPSL